MRNERRNLAQQRSLMYRFFRDKDNNLALWETPNAPLLVAMAALVGQLFSHGNVSEFFGLIFFGSVFAWGWLEIMYGTSLFRRWLGGLIMLAVVYFETII